MAACPYFRIVPMRVSLFRSILVFACCAMLAACGFQLRGPRPLPFASIYLQMNQFAEFTASLKRQIRANGDTAIAEQAADAEVVMQVTRDDREKVILSLSAAGTVHEFELRRSFAYRVVDQAGKEITPLAQIRITRTITFNDTQVLAKEQEETLLYRDMENDLIQQIVRRLAAIKKP